MPGILIDFSGDEYEKIPSDGPGKKRGWCRRILQEALSQIEQVAVERPVQEEVTYEFETQEGWIESKGIRPADAARKIGLVGYLNWRVKSEEVTNPLDV